MIFFFCQNMIKMQRLNDNDPPVLTSRLLLAPVTLPDMRRKEKGNHCNGQETTHHLSSSYSGENRPVFKSSGGLQVNDCGAQQLFRSRPHRRASRGCHQGDRPWAGESDVGRLTAKSISHTLSNSQCMKDSLVLNI